MIPSAGESFVLDAAVVAAFQRTGRLDALRALGLSLVVVDAVFHELVGFGEPNEHQRAIKLAVGGGWLRMEPLPAADAPMGALMNDSKLGFKVDVGEAASIALCLRGEGRVFVTPDRGAFIAAAKHLSGTASSGLSLYGFLRILVERHGFDVDHVKALVNYADQGGSLRPFWWEAWIAERLRAG